MAEGSSPLLTLRLAFVELLARDDRALRRLDWLLGVATDTWTWPEVIHPRTGGGAAGEGHDKRIAAELLSFVRTMLVHDRADGLDLGLVLPDSWRGQGIEVHDAPTRHGSVSYAIRWHGERPALLWELHPHDEAPVELRCPAFDPRWRSTERVGEVLLAPSLTRRAGAP